MQYAVNVIWLGFAMLGLLSVKIPHNNFTNEEVLWRTQLLAQCE